MQNRREFLRLASGLVALGGISVTNLNFILPAESLPAPGVQLFTFFNVLDNDVEGTLKKISALGVKNIESAFSKKGDYYGLKSKDFSALVESMGMKWRSMHVFGAPFKPRPGAKGPDGKPLVLPVIKNLLENAQEIIDQASEGGVEYLVAAHLPIGSAKEINDSLDILNKAGEAIKKAGMQLVYHNETADFATVDGKIPYEIFLTETNPDHLKFELDVAWALKGGADPVKLFQRYPGRFPLWHIKDMDKEYKTVYPLGQGTIDYKRYFESSKLSGLKYYFIEHEAAADPFTSLASSIADIKNITS